MRVTTITGVDTVITTVKIDEAETVVVTGAEDIIITEVDTEAGAVDTVIKTRMGEITVITATTKTESGSTTSMTLAKREKNKGRDKFLNLN